MSTESRVARVELTADSTKLEGVFKRAERSVGSFRNTVTRGLTSALRLASGAAVGAVAATAAAFTASGIQALKFEESMTRLKIASGQTGGQMAHLASSMQRISNSTGVAREDLLGATSAFVALTGDAAGARDAMELFAKVNKATGSSMTDISSTAAALRQNLKIDTADLEKSFSILIRGGKAGAIELKELAGLLASVAPLGAQFAGGLGTEGLADLSAALQLARQGFGSASEAATGLEALMGSIVRGASKFKSGGVEVYTVDKNGNKKLKGFQDIIESIGRSKLVKDPTALQKAFGSKEAYAAFVQLTKVEGAWTALADESKKANDVGEDYAKWSASASGIIASEWNLLKNVIAETFTPERIRLFAGVLRDVVGFARDALGAFGGIAAAIDEMTGGDQTSASRDEDDQMLEAWLARNPGKTAKDAAQVEPGLFGKTMETLLPGEDWHTKAARGARSRLATNARARRQARETMSQRMAEPEYVAPGQVVPYEHSSVPRVPGARRFEATTGLARPRAPNMSVRLTLDPTTQNLGAAAGNNRGQRQR